MIKVIGGDMRIMSQVTFIPGEETKRNHAMVTACSNDGNHPTKDEQMRTEVTLNAWGKNASIMAFYCYKGKQINVWGRLTSYTQDTGQVKANGDKILFRRNEISVERIQLLGDNKKKIQEKLDKNLAILKDNGRIAPEVVLTVDELLKSDNLPMVDYNPNAAAQTGMYGIARVYSKGRGFWDKSLGTAAAPVTTPLSQFTPAQIADAMALLQAQESAKKVHEAEVVDAPDPFKAGA